MKSQNLAYKYALIAIFFWSTVATAFKIALTYLNPITLVFFASISSMLILLCIIILKRQLKDVISYIINNWKLVLLLALINPFLYYLVLFQAYDALPAQEAQVINYTWGIDVDFSFCDFFKTKINYK